MIMRVMTRKKDMKLNLFKMFMKVHYTCSQLRLTINKKNFDFDKT